MIDNSSKTITKSIEKLTNLKLNSQMNNSVLVKKEETNVGEFNTELKKSTKEDLIDDYEFARKNIRSLLEKGMSTIDDAIQLIKESESPRVYEATSIFIKTLAELNKDLILLHNTIQKFYEDNNNDNESKLITNNTAIFLSSEELLNSVKKKL